MAGYKVASLRVRVKSWALCLATFALICNPILVSSQAQGLTEDQIKAAFLFNFMRFVEWPPNAYESAAAPIEVCISGNEAIAGMLMESAKKKLIESRAIYVRRVHDGDDLRRCHILFLDADEGRKSGTALSKVAGGPVLTVGETEGFTQRGGVFNFTTQDGRVKLELSLESAAKANLKISAKLIAVSRLVGATTVAGGH